MANDIVITEALEAARIAEKVLKKKRCSSCKKNRSVKMFHRNRMRKDGFNNECVKCKSKRASKYTKEHPEKSKEYYKNNKEKILLRGKNYRHNNQDKIKITQSIWATANKDYLDQYHYQYRSEHKDQIKINNEAYRLLNKEELQEYHRLWRQDHHENIAGYARKRRAHKKNSPVSDLTVSQWNAIKELYKWRCAYCGKKTVVLTQDHIIPLSKGGSHTMENIVSACRSCNSKKHTGAPLLPIQPLLRIVD